MPATAPHSRARNRAWNTTLDNTSVNPNSTTRTGWTSRIGPVASAAACNANPTTMALIPPSHTGCRTRSHTSRTDNESPSGSRRVALRCSTEAVALATAARRARITLSVTVNGYPRSLRPHALSNRRLRRSRRHHQRITGVCLRSRSRPGAWRWWSPRSWSRWAVRCRSIPSSSEEHPSGRGGGVDALVEQHPGQPPSPVAAGTGAPNDQLSRSSLVTASWSPARLANSGLCPAAIGGELAGGLVEGEPVAPGRREGVALGRGALVASGHPQLAIMVQTVSKTPRT